MALIQQPAFIMMVLLALVALAEKLSHRKIFSFLGPALLVIIMAAILANIGVIPTASNAPGIYFRIFEYAAPLGIFFLLLQVRLADLRFAGLPMLLMFVIASVGTLIGCFLTWYILKPAENGVDLAYAVTGMYASTYIGGSVNLNAVALHYDVTRNGSLFALINAVDNIVGTVWLMMTMFLPLVFQKWFPRKQLKPPANNPDPNKDVRDKMFGGKEQINMEDSAILIAFGFGTLWISNLISSRIPQIPSILVLTTIALVLAQIKKIHSLQGARLFGFLLIMLFLAVIGAFCDFSVLAASGALVWFLLLWVGLMVVIHGIVTFGLGALIGMDWDIIAVSSNAVIGGSASAPVCANSIGRPDLQLPGLLAGSLGSGVGTYIGILVAEILK
ncbi:DUF819 domain-containing protein [Pollutibacter soli]|uniref:DUF819 family protein n=1 Tax=Pollutibacter soli TaxID=3034157 RepID=UPI003013C457